MGILPFFLARKWLVPAQTSGTIAAMDTQVSSSLQAIGARLAHPRFFVLSGPSGAGKSTLLRKFLEGRPDWVESVSATTRAPRVGEEAGVDYFFLSPEEFSKRVQADGFLEYATVFGKNSYGTPRDFVEKNLAQGHNVIADLDVQGGQQVKARMPEAVLIFVAPPDAQTLEQRLRGRGTEDEATIARRLAEAAKELSCWHRYDFVVVNGDLEKALMDLNAIVAAARMLV
jgi:guanylate kinase